MKPKHPKAAALPGPKRTPPQRPGNPAAATAAATPDKASELEPVSGFEPLTCRLQGAIGPSWTVAGRRLISRLPAPIVAGRRPASVTACLRWLPIWLPAVGVPAVIGLHISGFADRSLKSRTRAGQLSTVPGWIIAASSGVLSHNLSSCLAHAAVPLMINRKRPGGCAVLRSQRTGGGDNPGLWLSRPGARCRIALGPFLRAARRTRRAGLRQRALHGLCRQAWFGIVQGLGTWLPQ